MMKKLCVFLVSLLMVGCFLPPTASELKEVEIERQEAERLKTKRLEEKSKYQEMLLLKENQRVEQIGENGVWCEDLCYNTWNGGIEMKCAVNCVNALKSGEQIIK